MNDGTLAMIGVTCMLLAVALASPDIFAGLYAVLGVIAGGFLSPVFLKRFKSRSMWSKITLQEHLTEEKGYNSLDLDYAQLIGKKGTTLTDLRPTGIISINNSHYSAMLRAEWISRHTAIKVIKVDGIKILVEQNTNEH